MTAPGEGLPPRLVLATGNAGKLREMRAILAPWQVDVRALSEYTADAAEETGLSFVENAILKARHAAAAAGLPAIADDSGLEVDALGGAPGVYSARWAGLQADDIALGDRSTGTADERQAGRQAGAVELDGVTRVDEVRVLDLLPVHLPDLRPFPGFLEELAGNRPERIALLDGVLRGGVGLQVAHRGCRRGGGLR